jgi:Sap, sulfolipid-1-addressing protein
VELELLNPGGLAIAWPHARMGEVFVIAVVSALDAGLLAAAVVMLGRPRPARQLLAYLIGGMGFSIIIGLLIVLSLHGSSVLRGLDKPTRGVIEVAAGGLLIFIAIAVAAGRRMHWHPRGTRKPNTDHPQSLPERALGHDSLWIAWAAGALYSAPGAEYLAGLALLAKLNAPAAASVAAILGFNVIMFALIELPLLGLVLIPDRTRSLTEKLNAWMTAHRQTLIVIVAGAGGAYLLVSGLTDLS